MLERGFAALLSVPLVIKDEGYGGITLYYRTPREFSQEDIELAKSVADQAALAIENARLRGQAEQAAAFAERSRLARELHDSVTQSLYSITLYSEAVARMLASGAGADAVEHLRELRATAQEALREMRLLIFQLSPPALDKGSLADALQLRLDAVEARGGLKVDLQAEGDGTPGAPRPAGAVPGRPGSAQQRAQARARAVGADPARFPGERDAPGGERRRVRVRAGRSRTAAAAWACAGCGSACRESGGRCRVESSPGRGTKVSILVPLDPETGRQTG